MSVGSFGYMETVRTHAPPRMRRRMVYTGGVILFILMFISEFMVIKLLILALVSFKNLGFKTK